MAENTVNIANQAVDNRYFSTESLTVGYNGTMGWALGENNSLDIALSLNYIHMGNDSQDRTLVMTDGFHMEPDGDGFRYSSWLQQGAAERRGVVEIRQGEDF